MKYITPHSLAFAEVVLLTAIPTWAQSPTGSAFLHGHAFLFDVAWALYAGWRAADHIKRANQPDPPPPGAPGAPSNQ